MNNKGLSPVVASIILIAVCVAVSIGVATWMGAITFTFMDSDVEKECFRSIEWFETVQEALEWAINEAPHKIETYSKFLGYDGINVTRHEIIVRPNPSGGYHVIISFYGVEE